ncbi:MAG: 50S ribosomal protein L16 [Candidatus Pacebacteria bacterium GW2011_GWB1_47_8]|nr:MAG: 50S ribosomal protein L16 [Candidatus Pacebacteria bacterium GW2011_GWA1_46_10]KKU84126.1 MAG: 50S ribosomal protein L16 [Candidatus Pacebacteria bacterium GW2011_GWB1_47_8]HCR80917.1 50S ribosomal protein L16 [Candidatus Paceibacterota bacterium]
MLQPKKSKYRKQFRGKNRGKAYRGNELAFAEFGLKAVTGGWVSAREIEAARKKITYVTERVGRYWIRVFPDKPITRKPVGVKMGSGKGAIEGYVAVVKPGMILFELSGVTEEMARSSFEKAGHKLSVKTVMVKK